MKTLRSLGALLTLALLTACGPDTGVGTSATVGPMVGHVEATRARVWFRSGETGTCTLEVRAEGGTPRRLEAQSEDSHDQCATWALTGLQPRTTYHLTVQSPDGTSAPPARFRTAPAPEAKARVRLALGSCATLEDDPTWDGIAAAKPDALVLLGDTPYIDTTDLDDARELHRAFLAVPDLAELLRQTALWTTWDDHDFGADNADGTLDGKAQTRRAYTEYRAQASYGEQHEGIYTSVRYGPVEVFLLDVRWFMNLEAFPGAAGQRSCLGARQRDWLKARLRASSAPFKLLVSGTVWHDKGGSSSDDWASYRAERDDLFRFLGTQNVEGCVLVGGDVHASQHAVFERTGAGYPLHQLVISPLHGRAWSGGDRRHAARRWGTVEAHMFLVIDVDTTVDEPVLQATWTRYDGTPLHRVTLPASGLARAARSARR